MELAVLGIFCLLLLCCVALGASILWALGAGLALFLLYGRKQGFSWRELGAEALGGVKSVRNILTIFLLIGMLTALWRAAGTIPMIVCCAVGFIRPWCFLVMTFLLNCLLSVLTGTSFGTAATMGVICAALGRAMGVPMALTGGAVLSGVYFGDRCSPVSTSALLVAELTGTSVFRNIRRMLRTAAAPFFLTCGVYALLGVFTAGSGQAPAVDAAFARAFVLHPVTLLPAAAVLLLSLLQVNVKAVMAASIALSLPVCVLVQHVPVGDLPRLLALGYRTADAGLAPMLNGGGVASMLRVAAIVCISSSYSGIFQKTGLLEPLRRRILALRRRTSPFAAILASAVGAAVIACNQTLTILLTHQLCRGLEEDSERFAVDIEDTAAVVAPLVPWSIAGAVPLAAIGAPEASLLLACFLYLLPLWGLACSLRRENGLSLTNHPAA